jgi:hypothetical protein
MATTSGCAITVGLLGSSPRTPHWRWVGERVVFLVLATGAPLCTTLLVGQRYGWPVLAIIGGALVLGLIAERLDTSPWPPSDRQRNWLAAGVIAAAWSAVPVITWLHGAGVAKDVDTRAVLATPVFAVGFGIFAAFASQSFAALGRLRKSASSPDSYSRLESVARWTWFRVIGVGGAFVVNAVVALGIIIGQRDPPACVLPAGSMHQDLLLASTLVTIALCLCALFVGGHRLNPSSRTALFAVGTPLVLAGGVFGLTPYLVSVPRHIPLYAGAVSAITFAWVVHSLRFHVTREDLQFTLCRVNALAGVIALACASAVYWLLAAALWSKHRPVTAPDASYSSVTVLVGLGSLVMGALGGLRRLQPTRRLTTYPAMQNVMGDLLVQLFTIMALVVAVAYVGRVKAGCTGIVAVVLAVTVFGVVPTAGRIGQLIWTSIGDELQLQRAEVPRVFHETWQDEATAKREHDKQIQRVEAHLHLQVVVTAILLVTTAGWLLLTCFEASRPF